MTADVGRATVSRPTTPSPIFDAIPTELRACTQFVLWRSETPPGREQTKVPYQPSGKRARSDDPHTWSTFTAAVAAYERGGFDGIGFVFKEGGHHTGVDLDGCRDPETGRVASWAQPIIDSLNGYTEVSPSGTGFKIVVRAKLPGPNHNRRLKDVERLSDKSPGIEVYGSLKFFTLTGGHVAGTPSTIEDCQAAINGLYARFWPPVEQTIWEPPARLPLNLSDQELLEHARRAQGCDKFVALFDQGDVSAYGGDDSAADLALCNLLRFWTHADVGRMDSLFRQSALYRPKWDRADYRQKTLEKALPGDTYTSPPRLDPGKVTHYAQHQAAAPTRNGTVHHTVDDEQGDAVPTIDAAELDLRIIAAQAWEALCQRNARNPFLFRYGGEPVRIDLDDRGHPVPHELTKELLRHELARAAEFFSVTKAGRRVVLPPMHVALDMLASAKQPLPVVTRLTRCPSFAPDGALQTTDGYHPRSRTYCALPPALVGIVVPPTPGAADVGEAKRLILEEMLGDFPFVAQSDRANAVGLGLLPVVRDMIAGPTPLHLAEGPGPGTGKGLLVDALLGPSCGRNLGTITQASDDDEYRKRVTALLRDGHPAIRLDNITRVLDSGALASALTGEDWTERILGSSSSVKLPITCVWTATGNNPTLSTEMARRTIRLRMDPGVDMAWERTGPSDRKTWRHPELLTWIDDNRARLVWAFLVLAQAWIASGKPRYTGRVLGSYERWSHVIGGILQYAGIAGFLENAQEFYATADVETAVWRALVEAWWDTHRSNEVGAADLFELALATDGIDLGKGNERSQRTTFGKALGRQRDRVIGDYRVAMTRKIRGAAHWQLLPTQGQEWERVNVVNVGERFDPLPMREKSLSPPHIAHTTEAGTLSNVHNVHTDEPPGAVPAVPGGDKSGAAALCGGCGQPATQQRGRLVEVGDARLHDSCTLAPNGAVR